MALVDDLKKQALITLDTPLFIYMLEEHPRYLPIVRPVFEALENGTISGITSVLTLLETLVLPFRTANSTLAIKYEAVLSNSRGLQMHEISRSTCRVAAMLRASYGVKTPDALQIATGLLAKSSVFVTNDRDWPKIPGVRIIQVDEYLKSR